jgi:hypothetical protein
MKNKKFTEKEIQIIMDNYPIHGSEYVANLLNRSINSIYLKANKLKLKVIYNNSKKCKYLNCDSLSESKGYCDKHYKQILRSGEFSTERCKIKNCDRLICYTEERLCSKHYQAQFRKNNKEKFKLYRKTNIEKNRDKLILKSREYYEKNKDKINSNRKLFELNNKDKLKLKRNIIYIEKVKKALNIYGNKCDSCTCRDLEILEWHHINPNMYKDKGIILLRKIINKNSKLDNILLLCANCHIHNNIKDHTSNQGILNLKVFSYGYCPKHHAEKHTMDIRGKALSIYKCKCQICNNLDLTVLQWHHRINYSPREDVMSTERRIIKENGIIEDIMLLCANCHKKQDLIDSTGVRNKIFCSSMEIPHDGTQEKYLKINDNPLSISMVLV